MNRRRQLVRTCKKHGLHVQPGAMQAMLEHQDKDDDEESLLQILSILQQKLARASPKIVTLDLWQQAAEDVIAEGTDDQNYNPNDTTTAENTENAAATSSGGGSHKTQASNKRNSKNKNKNKNNTMDFKIVNAFETPKLVFDSLRQQFQRKEMTTLPRPALVGTVDDKLDMMTQRYLRVQQRVARKLSLISIDRLLGTSSSSATTNHRPQKLMLLGLLQSTPDGGNWELEDLTGTIPLQFDRVSTHIDGSVMYTEGCLVLAQGIYKQGTFVVDRLGMPPLERKEESTPFLPHSASTTTNKAKDNNKNPLPLPIYSMANVALDDQDVVQRLEELVERLTELEDPAILVLMGNFTTESLTLSQACDELARIVEPLSSHAVLLVPGPNDTPSLCWPIMPITSSKAFRNMDHVQLVSNPCRLEVVLGGQQQGQQHNTSHDMVIFRQDAIPLHLQHQSLTVGSDTAMGQRIWNSLLSQGHLLPQAPIYWNYDHALSLYPLPDVLLLGLQDGDDAVDYFHSQAQCHVVAPGGAAGQWAKVTMGGGRRSQPHVELSQEEQQHDDMEEDE